MKQLSRTISFVAAILVASLMSSSLEAKSYSSGGGRSYSSSSSHSSSSHSSSGSSRSSSSGGSSSRSSSTRTTSSGSSSTKTAPGSSTKSYKSGTGKSYSSGSTWNDDSKKSYTSGKSYTAGANRNGSSSSSSPNSKRNDSEFTFDTAAARAKREADSKTEYNQFKSSQNPPAASRSSQTSGNVGGQRDWVYVPDTITVRTRPARQYNLFSPYWSRPVVVYRDPYSSFFWWWLLDRSLEDRAWWAYHHRFDMDPARYQSLLGSNQQLEARVAYLESQQTPRDPSYVPTGLDRDLMYTDHYIAHNYSNRPTRYGAITFWVFAVPAALGICAFFIWLIWFKRWQIKT